MKKINILNIFNFSQMLPTYCAFTDKHFQLCTYTNFLVTTDMFNGNCEHHNKGVV